MTLVATILGCGSSTGVPRVGMGWGDCDPNNPKNRRRRCSLLVERMSATGGRTSVLVDTAPDLREQLLDAAVEWLDGVLYTHEHADHTHGIDDLRPLVLHKRRIIDVHADERTLASIDARFGYCFKTPPGSDYPPTLVPHRIAAGRSVTIDGEGGPITALPYGQAHGSIVSLGFRFGGLAYSCDLKGLLPETEPLLQGLDIWILDALRYRPHPTHLSVDEALALVDRIKPKRAILTNLHSDLDYEILRGQLPPHIEPAYDGMKVAVDTTGGVPA